MQKKPPTISNSLLPTIDLPEDLRRLQESDLPQVAEELRDEMVRIVSTTGGHLGAGLGVVELTVALHYLFDTPKDKLIWDVGHQSYPHKILTGRKEAMRSIRQGGGLSGFTKRNESQYDAFGTAHSSTSISAALGMAVARDLDNADNRVLAVIGDGAMSAGMAYEALNNAGAMDSKLIVILNDNDMSIAPPVGAMSAYLSRLLSSKKFHKLRNFVKAGLNKLPQAVNSRASLAEEYMRGFFTGGTLFEELGFYYVGPIDGHNFNHLLPVLKNVRDADIASPVLVHVVTQKGKGYAPAEESADKYHGVSKFDVITGTQIKSQSKAPSYTSVFANQLIKEAEKDEKIIAISAAMLSGTGLDKFEKAYPNRCFDVGIAEQHAVTFAAGMACEGYRPFAAIYSTFLQRAYDQTVHDVAIQNLPVRFAIDRAGLVGADGATHAGAFDITYLCCLPNFVVMAAADEQELTNMVATAAQHDSGPIAFRYPRGDATGIELQAPEILTIGKGRMIQQGKDIAILSLGTRLASVLQASNSLASKGIKPTIADARFAKPLDYELIDKLVAEHDFLISVEEGSIGGFASHVGDYLYKSGQSQKLRFLPLYLPDDFIDQDSADVQYHQAGLSAARIEAQILNLLDNKISESQNLQKAKLS